MIRRRLTILTCAAVVCLPPAIAFAVASSSGGTSCEKRPDWAAWRKGIEEKAPTTRQRIADQIIACHSLDKHTKRYVRARLGRPELGYRYPNHWRWITGPSRGVPIDNENLLVVFARGHVSHVELENGG
jgi:hypothetical protein